ncbi:MAG: four helix bundle protein [Candidatus Sungbacteria bacterium]|uniref:Four helix bundle protein n=1 Tax=Candidatus Sungiibacteriota bacterium TaxID=2750080 RepID=A0A932YWK7_9BACT|nr:four helix bundle protein [Candidatus Sungbacteria bacterium]
MQNRTPLRERAYDYALKIIKFIDELNRRDASVAIISNQLLRSATSIGANVIEAQAGSTRKDFTNFFTHALKSANESKFWLGLLRDAGKAGKTETDSLLGEVTELANMLGAGVLTLKGKKKL